MYSNLFTDEELARRLNAVRTEMNQIGLDIILLSSPENIFYLIGLDHWGYFAPTTLIVPAWGDMVLITRQMEEVVIRIQVRNVCFIGHRKSETTADVIIGYLEGKTTQKKVGIEVWSSG